MKLSLAAAIGLAALALTEAVKVQLLPAPVTIQWGTSGPIKVDNGLRITGPRNAILSKAIARTSTLIKKERWTPKVLESPIPVFDPFPGATKRADAALSSRVHVLRNINISVDDLNAELQPNVDESYTLDINADATGTIKAKTIWGALHGLTTLEQIVIGDGKNGLQIEQSVHIEDAPKYTHRGVLYDTGRNFYPVRDLLRQIDVLAWSKFNVFHWHITDSQSWPVEIKKYPEMTRGGAYSAAETYSQKDLKTVIEYGRERGIRVYPEIDMPGHSAAGWVHLDPKSVTCANSWWDNDGWTYHTAVEPNPGQLDFSYPKTYEYISNVYKELSAIFTDNLFHVGFDEVHSNCYNFSTGAQDFLKANPGSTYVDFAQTYIDKAMPIFQDKPDRRVVMWEDVLLDTFHAHTVPKNVIMQSWNKGIANIKNLTSQGYDVIVTSSDFFYLDCGHGGWVGNDHRYNVNSPPEMPKQLADLFNDPTFDSNGYSATTFNFGGIGGSWCAPYKSWQRIYNYDFTAGLSAEEAKHVIGAELAMWSEQADGSTVDAKVWPRAAALAESLWSGNRDADGYKRTTGLTSRLLDYRERLVARGINAATLQPKYCLQHPHHCDFDYDQKALGK